MIIVRTQHSTQQHYRYSPFATVVDISQNKYTLYHWNEALPNRPDDFASSPNFYASNTFFLYTAFSCSSSMNVITVCGPSRKKYGMKPFHSASTLSCRTTFASTSIDPEYGTLPAASGFMFWMRVFAMSTGIETTVVTKPLIMLAVKNMPMPSCMPHCSTSIVLAEE